MEPKLSLKIMEITEDSFINLNAKTEHLGTVIGTSTTTKNRTQYSMLKVINA